MPDTPLVDYIREHEPVLYLEIVAWWSGPALWSEVRVSDDGCMITLLGHVMRVVTYKVMEVDDEGFEDIPDDADDAEYVVSYETYKIIHKPLVFYGLSFMDAWDKFMHVVKTEDLRPVVYAD